MKNDERSTVFFQQYRIIENKYRADGENSFIKFARAKKKVER